MHTSHYKQLEWSPNTYNVVAGSGMDSKNVWYDKEKVLEQFL